MENPVFTNAEITEQVNRITSSSHLKNSPVLCQFLQFVVVETLGGRAERIKEYTIGTQVMGRKSDFDPQIDAIVRIHAGRLRRALSEFYDGTGKNDALRITIPKGAYAPSFINNNQEETQLANSTSAIQQRKPILAVMPFRSISHDALHNSFCEELGEFLSTELAQFQELAVVSYSSCINTAEKTKDIRETCQLLGAEYILTGSIFVDREDMRMLLQLSRGNSGTQLWSNTFIRNKTGETLFEIQEEIVNLVAASLGGYYGVIYRDLAELSKNKSGPEIITYDPLFWYEQFVKHLNEKTFNRACESLEYAVKLDPDFALGWAVLSEIYAGGVPMNFRRVDRQTDVALEYAKKAIKLNPIGQHGYQAEAVCQLVARNKTAVLLAAEKCIAINPRAVTYLTGMGAILVFAGEYERGTNLLRKGLMLNPYFPWMHALAFSVYHFSRGEFDQSKTWADKMDMPGIPWCPMLKAASLAEMGQSHAAVDALNELIGLVPNITLLGKSYIGSFLLDEKFVDKFVASLSHAGLIFSAPVATSARITTAN